MVALSGCGEAQDDLVEDELWAVALDAGYQLAQADIFLRLLARKRDSAAEHQVKPAEAALLDVLQVGIFLYDKEHTLFALRIAANSAQCVVGAHFNRPAKTFFALKGVETEPFDIFGKRVARGRVLYEQILHKASRLPWPDAGEALKHLS